MQNEKWQGPGKSNINARYIVLSFSATILIALGIIGHFFPDLLSIFGQEAQNRIKENWIMFVGLGVAIGAINAFIALFTNKRAKPTQ